MTTTNEERIIAKNLEPPGPLLVVQRMLPGIAARRVRVIVSSRAAALEIVAFCESNGDRAAVDETGGDYHVIIDRGCGKDGRP